MDPLATLETIGDKAVLRFERRLAHPPAKVFAAISEPEELAHWFPARVLWELRPGAPIEFRFEDVDFEAPPGEVLEVDPPRLLVYAWGDGVLRWEVVADGAGSILRFTHTIAGEEEWPARFAAARQAAGWDVCLAALKARLGGTAGAGLDWLARNRPTSSASDWATASCSTPGARSGSRATSSNRLAASGSCWPTAPSRRLTSPSPRSPRAPRRRWSPRGCSSTSGCTSAVAGRVRWELRELAFGTGLVLTQTLPRDAGDLAATALAEWERRLRALIAQLHGVAR